MPFQNPSRPARRAPRRTSRPATATASLLTALRSRRRWSCPASWRAACGTTACAVSSPGPGWAPVCLIQQAHNRRVQPAPLSLLAHAHLCIRHPPPPGYASLLARSKALDLPKNPLDDLIERLGGPEVRAGDVTSRESCVSVCVFVCVQVQGLSITGSDHSVIRGLSTCISRTCTHHPSGGRGDDGPPEALFEAAGRQLRLRRARSRRGLQHGPGMRQDARPRTQRHESRTSARLTCLFGAPKRPCPLSTWPGLPGQGIA